MEKLIETDRDIDEITDEQRAKNEAQSSYLLINNSFITSDQYLNSLNKAYYARMQQDGNFVLYVSSHFSPKNAIWSSQKCGVGTPPYKLIMQTDGNLVIYDSKNQPTWASGTYKKGKNGHYLIMQDDGNLVIYDGADKPVWSTKTDR